MVSTEGDGMVPNAAAAASASAKRTSAAAASRQHVVLQLSTQLHVYRLKLMFDAGNRNIFPEGFAQEAIEVGPTSESAHEGPCLLLLTHVALAPQDFNNWLESMCLDWAVQRIFWLPPSTSISSSNSQPCAFVSGQQALLEAVTGLGLSGGVRLQVYPRSLETTMAELVKDRVALDLDAPQHVLHIIQWPSAAVAAARDALKAAEAQHARVFKTQDKTQGRAKRLADKLQAVAGLTDLDADDGDGGGGAAGGGIASHRSGVAVGDVDSANDADGDENVDEHHGQHRGSGRGGDRRDRECLSDQGMRPARLMTSGIIKGAGDTQPGGGSKVTVIDSISGIADEAERAQAAAARARLERHRLRVRDERRAALAGRMREERDALLAALTAAEAESTYSIGLSPAASAYWYSPTREKKVPSQLCRAAGKLREALIVSGLWGGSCLKPGLTAIDVGSAPGGWTQTLAACGAGLVVSIDPADMDPGVLAHPAVRHIKLKCQDAVSSGALAEHLTGAGRGSVDLVVCDVNAHPNDAVAMLTPVLPLLAPGGRLVLTLKTFGRGRGKEAWEAELVRLLGDGFERGTLLWLLANTPCERTYVAQRRA